MFLFIDGFIFIPPPFLNEPQAKVEEECASRGVFNTVVRSLFLLLLPLLNPTLSSFSLFFSSLLVDLQRRRLGTTEEIISMEQKFFEVEKKLSFICRDPAKEANYLRDLSEVLLYLVLPPEDFTNKAFRYLCRVRKMEIKKKRLFLALRSHRLYFFILFFSFFFLPARKSWRTR